ncbi:MAG: peptidyl-prolyl cis-trans isomerase [Gammaproteobacteria bacterium]|nr:peptidyl-prolyl cis-trans isomerase [Gammaproteobacteria bacterium]
MMKTLLFSLTLILSGTTQAAVDYTLSGEEALRIGDAAYAAETLRLLQRAAIRERPEFSLVDTARLVIDNHLLAGHALGEVPEAELLGADDRVGFPGAVFLEEQLIATVQSLFPAELEAAAKALPEGGLDGLITEHPAWTPARLRERLSLGKRQEFRLEPAELARLEAEPVLVYRFLDSTETPLSLAELYRRQNVQGRIRLHEGDVDFLAQQARARLGGLFVRHWLERRSGLPARVRAELERTLWERHLKDRYLAHIGLQADVHDDNAHLRAVAATIPPAAIRAYYLAHREEFKRVARARGRHIQLTDQAQAERAHAELQAGLDFDAAVRRHSQAEDKDAKTPGALGWVVNDGQALSWRDTLLLVLPVGQVSRPLKAPGQGGWEIVRVDERIDDYQAADSEGVRYLASQILARRAVAERFHHRHASLLAGARLSLNPAVLGRGVYGEAAP